MKSQNQIANENFAKHIQAKGRSIKFFNDIVGAFKILFMIAGIMICRLFRKALFEFRIWTRRQRVKNFKKRIKK